MCSQFRISLLVVLGLSCALPAHAETVGELPEIISSPGNRVPDCVTPDRLMEFARNRNRALAPPQDFDSRFSNLASIYKNIGDCVQKINGVCLKIRWDIAFFQMLVETNYLLYTGGVKPGDNNFAGVGATIAGKPGERFGSINEGVLAHLQHVSMYAGAKVENPVAKRTRVVQNFVYQKMRQLGRPVTFEDLATLWVGSNSAAYVSNIKYIASSFYRDFCQP